MDALTEHRAPQEERHHTQMSTPFVGVRVFRVKVLPVSERPSVLPLTKRPLFQGEGVIAVGHRLQRVVVVFRQRTGILREDRASKRDVSPRTMSLETDHRRPGGRNRGTIRRRYQPPHRAQLQLNRELHPLDRCVL